MGLGSSSRDLTTASWQLGHLAQLKAPPGSSWVPCPASQVTLAARPGKYFFTINALRGAPEEIRTPDPQIRSLVLKPCGSSAVNETVRVFGTNRKNKSGYTPFTS